MQSFAQQFEEEMTLFPKYMQLDIGDMWLIEEISDGLCEKFNMKKSTAMKLIFRSNFLRMLEKFPEQVHHDTPNSWVNSIARQMNLKQKSY